MLQGKLLYLHGSKSYLPEPGDSLFFDTETTHGPAVLVALPIPFLSTIVSSRMGEP